MRSVTFFITFVLLSNLLFISSAFSAEKEEHFDVCSSYLEMLKGSKISKDLKNKLNENLDEIEIAFEVPKDLGLERTMFHVAVDPVPFRGSLGYVIKESGNIVVLKGSKKEILQSMLSPASEEVEFHLSSELITDKE